MHAPYPWYKNSWLVLLVFTLCSAFLWYMYTRCLMKFEHRIAGAEPSGGNRREFLISRFLQTQFYPSCQNFPARFSKISTWPCMQLTDTSDQRPVDHTHCTLRIILRARATFTHGYSVLCSLLSSQHFFCSLDMAKRQVTSVFPHRSPCLLHESSHSKVLRIQ